MKPAVLLGAILLICSIVCAADEFRDAVAAYERGDLTSAESILKTLVQKQPNDSAALGLQAVILDAQKKFTEADQLYRRALRLAPNSASLLNNFGNHLLATGDSAAARTIFLKVVAIRPEHPNANLQLAAMSADAKQGKEALTYLDHLSGAEQSSPQIAILRMRALYLTGQDKEAQQIVSSLADSAPQNPQLSFSLGLALASVEKYQQAEDFFSRALAAEPNNFDVLYNLGLATFHSGNSQRAREVLQAALKQRPEDVDTLYNLAVVNINLKQREGALPLLAQAARLAPTRANLQLTLAETLSAVGYYADALTAYETYLKLKPGDIAAQREHAFMLAVCGRREEGIPKLQEHLRSHPKDATAHYEIAVLESSTNAADAASHLEKALQIDPNFVPARFGRGVLNYLGGHFAAALPDLEFAAQKYPDNPTVLDRLGKTYTELDRFPEATNTLRKASELAPTDATILLHFSRALSATGNKEEARAVLERFRAVGSDRVGHIPAAGFVDLLNLPKEQLHAQYRAEVERRLEMNPQDAALTARYLKLLVDEGRMADAGDQTTRLLELKPPPLVAADAARALVVAAQYGDAKKLLEYAAGSSRSADIKLDLAIASFHTDGPQTALAQLDQIAPAERGADYYLARAQVLDAMNKSDEALADAQRSVSGPSSRPELYEPVAMLLAKNKRPGDAVRLLEAAASTFPDNRNILLLQAAMCTAAQRVGDAERILKQIQNRWPEWAQSYVTYGILLEGQKRSEEGKAQLETAIALGASGPEVYLYLAKSIYSATPDRLDEAAKAINQAVTLDPGNALIQALAGRIEYEKKNYQAAVVHLREAVRLRPGYLQTRYTLAQAYRALGLNEDAAREAQEFQKLRAENPKTDDESDF